jgi:hypothetical protein
MQVSNNLALLYRDAASLGLAPARRRQEQEADFLPDAQRRVAQPPVEQVVEGEYIAGKTTDHADVYADMRKGTQFNQEQSFGQHPGAGPKVPSRHAIDQYQSTAQLEQQRLTGKPLVDYYA